MPRRSRAMSDGPPIETAPRGASTVLIHSPYAEPTGAPAAAPTPFTPKPPTTPAPPNPNPKPAPPPPLIPIPGSTPGDPPVVARHTPAAPTWSENIPFPRLPVPPCHTPHPPTQPLSGSDRSMPLSRILYNTLRTPLAAPGLTDATLRIFGLPTTCDELLLYQLFSPFGAVLGVQVHRDPRGVSVTAEVQFARYADAVLVREELRVATLGGRQLRAVLVPPSPISIPLTGSA